MAQYPLDYATRSAIAAVEKWVVKKAMSEAEARSLLAAIANARSAVSKQTDRHPDEDIEPRITQLQKEHPSLIRGQAQQQVMDADADLWERHVQAMRVGRGNPALVEKQAPLTYEEALQMAEARVAKTAGLTRLQALAKLVQEHPEAPEFYATYRTYQMGAGVEDQYQARIAALRTGQ